MEGLADLPCFASFLSGLVLSCPVYLVNIKIHSTDSDWECCIQFSFCSKDCVGTDLVCLASQTNHHAKEMEKIKTVVITCRTSVKAAKVDGRIWGLKQSNGIAACGMNKVLLSWTVRLSSMGELMKGMWNNNKNYCWLQCSPVEWL